MGDLCKGVTGEWIKASAQFRPTPSKIPVQMYVEGDDDVKFWDEAVRPYQKKYDIKVVTNKAINPNGGNGKAILLSMLGLCEVKVVAVDADLDLIITNYSDYTSIVRNNAYVVTTTWYSIENVLLQNTQYIPLVENFSLAAYDLYASLLAMVEAGHVRSPIKTYGKMMTEFGVQQCANIDNFSSFEKKYNAKFCNLLNFCASSSATMKTNLSNLGYKDSDIWKLTRGHYLWNMIVKPQMMKDINRKITQNIQGQVKALGNVSRNQVMKSMGITKSVKDYVDDEFYGRVKNITLPPETRAKLDKMFP